jgi:hypothetical protein
MTEWRAVLGYEEFYEVSDTGRVRSFDRFVNHWRGGQRLVKGRELKSFFTSKSRERDYLRVGLYKRDRRLRVYGVHVLVLEAFVGPRPEGLVACHYNGVSTDNRLENLRWDTLSANSQDDIRNGVHPAASKTHCIRGHEFNSETTSFSPGRSRRRCLVCARLRDRENYVPAKPRTHCRDGHELTSDNVYLARDGQRVCRTCKRAWQRSYRKPVAS